MMEILQTIGKARVTMTGYRYVLMDVDNTLLDFDFSERHALAKTLASYGYPVDGETVGAYHRANKLLWDAFEKGDITQEELIVRRFQEFMDAIGGNYDPAEMNQRYMERLASCSRMLPGAEDFCQTVAREGRSLAIVTNGVAMVQHGRVDHAPIRPLFEKVYISAELGCRKPSAAIFDAVCQDMGITDRSQAVVFGDSLTSDVLGGVNAGMDTIWFNPKHAPQDAPIQPTWETHTYQQAAALIGGETP